MDNNNLNETPVVEVQDVQETVEQAEQVTYNYAADAEEAVAEAGENTYEDVSEPTEEEETNNA